MKVCEIVETLGLKVVAGNDQLDNEVTSGFVGDLLSVVMGKAQAGSAWITIQSHLNIIAVATLVDVACVIVSEGFVVDDNAIEKANEEDIVILTSEKSSYELASLLTKLGVK